MASLQSFTQKFDRTAVRQSLQNFGSRVSNTQVSSRVSGYFATTPAMPLDVHNVLDYVTGATLCFTPSMLRFSHISRARWAFIGFGTGLIGYSLVTNYRYSVAKLLPLGAHMSMDVASGMSIMAAPWIFGYRKQLRHWQLGMHFALGMSAWLLVAFTRPRSERGRQSLQSSPMMPTSSSAA